MKIRKKIIVVTGGANGIGKACIKELHKAGAIVIDADIDMDSGEKLNAELNERSYYLKTDISNEEDLNNLKEFIIKRFGGFDILINNAAIQTESELMKTELNDFKRVINVNLNGTFMCSRILGNILFNNGKIINMISVHYNKPRKYKYAYDASKAGIAMLTKEMALELIDNKITVNALSYGACYTNMNDIWKNNNEKKLEAISKIPLKWIAKPEEIARFLKIILEEFSDYTTGTIFSIDGGRSLY